MEKHDTKCKKTERLQIEIDPKLKKRIAVMAVERSTTIRALVTKILTEFLKAQH